ncbi:hypothetical protein HPB47_012383 [Ixodes persulcatus]|uniref:Uncharacterized protein n=1 Tax=Ixodes persulcatus TaxID=34615 RepID=A0AC60NTV4_IXOPE|nr:hypothetical protein HPB47_012383 [Ixodes persulcatus]
MPNTAAAATVQARKRVGASSSDSASEGQRKGEGGRKWGGERGPKTAPGGPWRESKRNRRPDSNRGKRAHLHRGPKSLSREDAIARSDGAVTAASGLTADGPGGTALAGETRLKEPEAWRRAVCGLRTEEDRLRADRKPPNEE